MNIRLNKRSICIWLSILLILCILAFNAGYNVGMSKTINNDIKLAEIEKYSVRGVGRVVSVAEVADVQPVLIGEFKLTAYCPCQKCCGEWADGVTYTGTTATANRTIAVDPDVIPLNSVVEINGNQYTAEDIGGAIQGNRIDIFFQSHEQALQFGVQYADVYLKGEL